MPRGAPVIALGVVGRPALAEVDDAGQVHLADGRVLRWWVAAEDRWHDPIQRSGVRQHCIGGAPVVETRVRVPGGDVVARVYAVAERGGLVVLEWSNESSASVAIALDGPPVASARPLVAANATGAGIAAGAVAIPVAHGAVATVAWGDGELSFDPRTLAGHASVVAGWERHVAVAGRYGLPEPEWAERVVSERSQLVLLGVEPVEHDPVAMACGAAELVRMGADAEPFVVSVAEAAGRCARDGGPLAPMALAAAAEVLAAAGERRAVKDVGRLAQRLGAATGDTVGPPDGAAWLWWLRSRLVACEGEVVSLLPATVAPAWFGQSVEVLEERCGPYRVGFAVRWHGERPALLWEISPAPAAVRCPGLDPTFRSDQARGEALLAAPAAVSFS